MAITLKKWVEDEVAPKQLMGLKYLTQQYFHRVEARGVPIDQGVFFTPADGVIVYAHESIGPTEQLIQVKGENFSLEDLLDDELPPHQKYLVVSIFMTFYSQHQNYIPFAGNRTFEELPPIKTRNIPMLPMEKALLEGIVNPELEIGYLKNNSREISKIFAPKLGLEYFLVRVGDIDVDTFVNWGVTSGEDQTPYQQNDRFGMITYGSSTIMIIPQPEDGLSFKLRKDTKPGMYVKCCKDALVDVIY